MNHWKCRTVREKGGGLKVRVLWISLGCFGAIMLGNNVSVEVANKGSQTLINGLLSVGPCRVMDVVAEKELLSMRSSI